MKHFTYKVEKLIKCVERRPALWDKTLEMYKDREERRHAWEEIFRYLDDGYDSMTREDKRATSDLIINKWTNIRDTFIKSLKIQSVKSGTKRYLYHDDLAFLLKVMPQHILPDLSANGSDPDDDPISYSTYVPGLKREGTFNEEASSSTPVEMETREKRSRKTDKLPKKILDSSPETSHDYTPKRSKRSEVLEQRTTEECPPVDFIEINEINDPRVMNEDEAFFASLLPTVVKYSEDERLEFRIEVLAVMKNISNKRRHKWLETE